MAPVVDDGETTAGLEADPGVAPVSMAIFSRYGGVPSTALWAETGSTKVLRVEEGPGCSRRGPRRRKSKKRPVARGRGWVVAIGRYRGGIRAHPSRCPAWVAT